MEVNEERRIIQEEALSALKKNNYNGIVILPTGTGKSWVMIECLRKIREEHGDVKVLYLCNSTSLRDVGFKEELKKWEVSDENIEFLCYQSAYKLKDKSFDVLLADEFDYCLTPNYSKVFQNNKFNLKILVSATIEENKREIADKIAPIVYEKSLQEIEEKGVLNKSNYYFLNYKINDDENIKYLAYNDKFTKLLNKKQQILLSMENEKEHEALKRLQGMYSYNSFQIESLVRSRKLFLNSLKSSVENCRHLMKDIYDTDKQCRIVVFCELTDQADKVCKYTYHGKSEKEDNLNAFKEEKIQALAVVGKINRGENIKGINNIIVESCNSSVTQIIQRLGRGKRLKQDEILNVYFLVPYYMENGKLKPTKTLDWIYKAAKDLVFQKAKNYKFK